MLFDFSVDCRLDLCEFCDLSFFSEFTLPRLQERGKWAVLLEKDGPLRHLLHDCRHLYTCLLYVPGWSLALVHDWYPMGTCGIRTCLSTFFPAGTESSLCHYLFHRGLFFTLGGLIYAIKKQRLVPGVFSFHELFHIMVLISSGLHYAMIYTVYFQRVA